MTCRLPAPGEPPRGILETYTKAHSAEYQAQALIDLAIELAPQIADLDAVEEIVVETSHHTHNVIGTGSNDPQKFDPDASRETLDHSIMYILAVALEDRRWHHEASYARERAHRPSTIALWRKIRTVEDPAWTARYHEPDPAKRAFGGRISIRMADGSTIAGEKAAADAHPNGARPWRWEDYVGKFDSLTEGMLPAAARESIPRRRGAASPTFRRPRLDDARSRAAGGKRSRPMRRPAEASSISCPGRRRREYEPGDQPEIPRARIDRRDALLMPGAANALAARVIEDLGFEAVYLSGAGLTNTYLGLPDLGFVGLAEIAQHTAAIRDAVELPIVVDADTGFGNALNVRQTIRTLERAGASAVQIEDQVSPKRCGHFSGKDVIPLGEMLGKVKAAVDARHDPNLLILARTDARATQGFDAAIDRAAAFIEAGADMTFVEAPESPDEMRAIAPARGAATRQHGGRRADADPRPRRAAGHGLRAGPLRQRRAAGRRPRHAGGARPAEGDGPPRRERAGRELRRAPAPGPQAALRRAGKALFFKGLAGSGGGRRSHGKSWRRGHRPADSSGHTQHNVLVTCPAFTVWTITLSLDFPKEKRAAGMHMTRLGLLAALMLTGFVFTDISGAQAAIRIFDPITRSWQEFDQRGPAAARTGAIRCRARSCDMTVRKAPTRSS